MLFGQLAMDTPQQGFYTLLMDYPAFPFIGGVATIVGLLFYVTSADSGALVMANLTSHLRTPHDDAAKGVRIFWGVATGLLTAAMLVIGGISALQNATIIMALPSSLVLVLVLVGLYKALRVEAHRVDSHRRMLHGWLSGRTSDGSGGGSWKRRLGRSMTFPSESSARDYLERVGVPALEEVGLELGDKDVDAQVDQEDLGNGCVALTADLDREFPFCYRIRMLARRVPTHAQVNADEEEYALLEVHLGQEGGQGYDVMGYTHSQLIDDVLDQYEKHLEFLRLKESGAQV